ncbi:MAG: transcriptional regulator NrdR [Myxococcota bacterium]
MMCPSCQHEDTKVVDSRDAGDCTRRRRECLLCGARFTTFERVEYRLPTVVKRDGRKQAFSRDKLLAGLELACRKRPVTDEQLDSLVSRVEKELAKRPDREITTADIGAMALGELQNLDHVAYLRFASVYHAVGSPEDFLEVLRPVLERR